MIRFIRQIQARNTDEGASAVEYGLLVAAIAAIIVLLVFAVGKFVKQGFQDTCDGIKKNASASVSGAANCS
jgi:pilus assembly protein Flp/PilA